MELEFEKHLNDLNTKLSDLKKINEKKKGAFQSEIAQLEKDLSDKLKQIYSNLTPWQTVQVARHPNRPTIKDYINGMFTEFIELHGDRYFGDDHGIIGGFASINDIRIILIGHQKGKTVEENIKANFGMANPEGYRKALRLMRLAEKYSLPVLSLIDTPGAYPGMDAEARGQAEAIAKNLMEMATLRTPIIAIITGEGGSGGAIGIGVGDIVMMLSHSIYSVISPEGCASILWRDASKAPEAAATLKITANSLLELGVIDEVIPEPIGGAHRNYAETMETVKEYCIKHLIHLKKTSINRLVEKRYEKYTNMGRAFIKRQEIK